MLESAIKSYIQEVFFSTSLGFLVVVQARAGWYFKNVPTAIFMTVTDIILPGLVNSVFKKKNSKDVF